MKVVFWGGFCCFCFGLGIVGWYLMVLNSISLMVCYVIDVCGDDGVGGLVSCLTGG